MILSSFNWYHHPLSKTAKFTVCTVILLRLILFLLKLTHFYFSLVPGYGSYSKTWPLLLRHGLSILSTECFRCSLNYSDSALTIF